MNEKMTATIGDAAGLVPRWILEQEKRDTEEARASLAASNAKIQELETLVESKDSRIVSLKRSLAKLEETTKDAISEACKAKSEVEGYKRDLRSSMQRVDTLTKRHKVESDRRRAAQRRSVELARELDAAKKEAVCDVQDTTLSTSSDDRDGE